MLKFYMWGENALRNLRDDPTAVVSLEYVIVAAAIIGVVALAFGSSGLGAALSGAMSVIGSKITSAVG